ncbi:MAG: hypothetical protein M1815_002543 [Lichina confinis]|nr:MAG: hypothetical protein M1815_002543 [Lichina confinis]
MAIQSAPQNSTNGAAADAGSPSQHPFTPLTVSEIETAARLVKQLYPETVDLLFKTITLEEPNKDVVVPLLIAEHEGRSYDSPPRRAFVSYYIHNTDKLHEAIVNVSTTEVERNVRLGPNIHGSVDAEELVEMERIALEDESVKRELQQYGFPEGTVAVCDPWIYGSDGVDDDRRQYQCFLYVRDPMTPGELDCNHYAMPLDISPVIDVATKKVTRIDRLPTGADTSIGKKRPYKVQPPSEYLPNRQQLRTDLKPLHVVQPEGVSFRITRHGETGNVIEWQKWRFRVGFNQREGMVIFDTRYDGRPLFYRMALSDMTVPYADPRRPYHKKQAFDLGDAGAGGMSNNLKLGCDCLGSIHYLDGVVSNSKGEANNMDNVICVHEVDSGIIHKHVNYRTGAGVVARNRELVVQSIITVANYDYVLAWMFNQAGEVSYEVRATGIVSTCPIDDGVDVPWGTVVHPGVLATHHQHIFSLRVDPALDGYTGNRLTYEEAHTMPRDPELNPHGVGFVVKETVIEESGAHDLDFSRNRTFKIQNANATNPVNGKPVGYKIQLPGSQAILADEDSFHHKRAEFADHAVYVTRYRDDELYAGGKYTNQSRGGAGVRSWADRKENVKDADLVLWLQFGLTHIPRIEDFPIMPVETIRVSLKPSNFFDKNPALDVAPAEQTFNQSVLLSESHCQPGVEAVVGANGHVNGHVNGSAH